MPKKKLFLIHGAWSGPKCFNYISEHIDVCVDEIVYFKYRTQKEDLSKIVSNAKHRLAELEGEYYILGHSLGGIIALNLINEKNCKAVITLASPLSGIKLNPMFQTFLIYRAPILQDICEGSKFIKNIHKQHYEKPVFTFVSTQGFNPGILEPSDGVVTIASQETWLPSTAVSFHVESNHHEILQSKDVVATLRKILK